MARCVCDLPRRGEPHAMRARPHTDSVWDGAKSAMWVWLQQYGLSPGNVPLFLMVRGFPRPHRSRS